MARAQAADRTREWLAVHEACELIGVSPATLRRLSDAGYIRAFTTPGGHRRFARSAILELVSGQDGRLLKDGGNATDVDPPGRPAAPVEPQAAHATQLVALVAHARRVPSTVREVFAAQLAALEPSSSILTVRTCHRVELYAVVGGLGERTLPELPPGARRLKDEEAVRHAVAVACGLDSAVLGEDQILHQVREAVTRHRAAAPLDPALDRLFQSAFNAGRRARSWLTGPRRSLGDHAVERIAHRVGSLEGRSLLIVGAGTIGRLAALSATARGAEVIVASRTEERAGSLAAEVGGRAIPFAGVLPGVDGVVIALAGAWGICAQGARELAASDAIVVDLSSPPSLPAALRDELADRLVSIDDLAWGDESAPHGTQHERLGALVADTTSAYMRWLSARDAQPVFEAMTDAAEHRRKTELEWLGRRLPELSERESELIEQMSRRLVAGLLHAPRTALNSDGNGDLADAARELFGL